MLIKRNQVEEKKKTKEQVEQEINDHFFCSSERILKMYYFRKSDSSQK